MRRQLDQRTLLIAMSIAIVAIGGLVIWADDTRADDIVPGTAITPPDFESAVVDSQPSGAPSEGCVFCDQAASTQVCPQCDRDIAGPPAPLGVWLDPAGHADADAFVLPLLPPTQSDSPGLVLPAPWWSQLPAPAVRSAKTLLVSDLSTTGPSLSFAPSFETSAEVASSCQLAPCFESTACKLAAAAEKANSCEGEICAGETCIGGACTKCAADATCTAQNETTENDIAESDIGNGGTDETVIEQPVVEIIQIIDSLGESVVSGTLFEDAPACQGDGSCTHDGECVAGDGPCTTTRDALIAELQNLAAAEATACDTLATGCPLENGVPDQAAACASPGQPVSVLTVQNPYVGQAGTTPINVDSHRQAASRVDATADTLEVDGLYEAADVLRQIADELRLKAREQALSAPVRAVPPQYAPYRPVYPAPPSVFAPPQSAAPSVPVVPEAYVPTPRWSMPVLEALRRAGAQPPVQ